ncbi:MAG: DUF1127 domain-containing protein [Pseudoruegeria sp.]
MALSEANTHVAGANGFKSLAARFFDWMISVAETQSRAKVIDMLNSKSDTELAALGIERSEIARHVFRDKIFM